MSVTDLPEYRKLRLDSSNDLMRHDGRRAEGEYVQAALLARQAGLARQQMAAMAFAAGEYVRAASDWLSAAACFYLVPDLDRMRECLASAQQLEREGRIPAENRHVFAALREREEQGRELSAQVQAFLQDFSRRGGLAAAGDPGLLDWLVGLVRTLPGEPRLHAAIYFQASRLGLKPLAADHVTWAHRLDPDNASFTALYGREQIAQSRPDEALAVGRAFIASHPNEAAVVRMMMAEAIVVAAGGRGPDLEAALGLLLPVGDDPAARPRERLAAIGLTAMLQQVVGTPEEFDRTLAAFNRVAAEAESAEAQQMVVQLHASLRRPAQNGAAEPHRPSGSSVSEPDFAKMFQEFVGRLAA